MSHWASRIAFAKEVQRVLNSPALPVVLSIICPPKRSSVQRGNAIRQQYEAERSANGGRIPRGRRKEIASEYGISGGHLKNIVAGEKCA